MTLLDSTVVGIALPVIGKDFHAGVAGLQWVVTGYLLTLAGLLLLGGVLGDRYGRRRVFLIGVVWFALASLCCGIAPNAPFLVAARILQGLGGALLTPGSLAILQSAFVERDRPRAIGSWSGLGGVATAIGPFLGGYLIAAVSWRLIFFINLPVALLVILAARHAVPESRDPNASPHIDVLGALLATGGLVGLTYGLVEGPELGWGAPVVALALALGVGALTGFVVTELRFPHPLLAPEMFRSRQFSVANLVTFAIYGALGGTFFLMPIELEQVASYSPLEAGAASLPITVLMLALSARFGALAVKVGPRLLMGIGPLVVALGLELLTRVGSGGSYLADVFPALVVFGLGLSITVAPLTSTVLAAAPGGHSGAASAVNNDVARTASLIAVAVLPAAAGLSGSAYLHPLVFNAGFHTAVRIAALACASGGILSLAMIRNPPGLGSPEGEGGPDGAVV